MRWIIPIIFIFLFDSFVFQAFSQVLGHFSPIIHQIGSAIYWSMPVMLILMVLAKLFTKTKEWNTNAFSILQPVLAVGYFSKIFAAGVLLFDDLRRFLYGLYLSLMNTGAVDIERSLFVASIAAVAGLFPFCLLLYGVFRNRHRYKLFSETIELETLPEALDGLRIVQISDIHSGSWTLKEPVKMAIDLINQQKADLVFFTGDLVNSAAQEMEEFKDLFAQIKSRYGTFSILGNHDYGDYYRWGSKEEKVENFQRLKDIHKEMGWDLMLNENRILEINGEKLNIIGVENYSASGSFHKYGDMEKATEGMEKTKLQLLLSHDPSHWTSDVIENYKNVDVTFSGHTHGMQFGIEIPGWFKWSPAKYVYKQWAGLYENEGQFLYVNRGLGYLGYPGRVGILPEVTLIELKRPKL